MGTMAKEWYLEQARRLLSDLQRMGLELKVQEHDEVSVGVDPNARFGWVQCWLKVPDPDPDPPVIRYTLLDRYGNLVESMDTEAVRAAITAAKFVYMQGCDPDERGKDATPGTVRFEPVGGGDDPDNDDDEEEEDEDEEKKGDPVPVGGAIDLRQELAELEKKFLEQKAEMTKPYRDALACQDASNFSGVAISFGEDVAALCDEYNSLPAEDRPDRAEWFKRNPAVLLFLSKLTQLAGFGPPDLDVARYGEALKACEARLAAGG